MPVNQTNLFGLHQYDYKESFFGGNHPLGQGAGYGIVLGMGLGFCFLIFAIMEIVKRFGGRSTNSTSEDFNCGGRSVKTGLIAVDVVSKWTWAATLLQSSNVAYKDGVSGPFWYAAGATVQVVLFGLLAIEIKRKAPTAHTVLEIINARWGRRAHITFLVFCLMTNVIVSAMLILGGAAVMTALTGMNLYAACMLIPATVIIYTFHGGLIATFISAYLHTIIIYVVLCLFAFTVYARNETLGSPARVWENLQIKSRVDPIPSNMGGSYLTMFSKGGLIFGVINVIGNFGTVFNDQAYWQSAIAARPSAAYKGYLLGAVLWFCIPFTLATSLGLGCAALDLPVTVSEAAQGLVPPAVAYHLLGSGGAIVLTIMLFMAVTSAGSAELIAVSSIISYDIYRTYINKLATGHQMLRMSQYVVVAFGIIMGVIGIILNVIGLPLGFVYETMGVLIGSAVVPIACCLLWRKTSCAAAMTGAIAGLLLGLVSWLVYAAVGYGGVNQDALFEDYVMLTGNIVALGTSGIITISWSLIRPDNYDFISMRNIPLLEDADLGMKANGQDSPEGIQKAYNFTRIWGSVLAFVLIILWPCLALPATVFSKGYFTFWVILSIIWGLCATVIATLLPLWESWRLIWTVFSRFITCNTARIDDLSVRPSQKHMLEDNSNTPSTDSEMDPKVAALAVTNMPPDDGMDPKVGYVDPPTQGLMTK
ncbi:hypothetical protein WJX74_001443 [Apatococcus lobatus]|uniref:Uncharacterized protein n=1 Tax=Apatococcus lobatus TaxID=904363 RepID=A0AAW1QDN4_9CHLO